MAEAYREIEPEDSDSDLEYSDALENELGNADLKSDEFSAVKKDEKIDSNDKFFDVEGAEEDKADSDEDDPKIDPLKLRQEEEDKISDEEREVFRQSFGLKWL